MVRKELVVEYLWLISPECDWGDRQSILKMIDRARGLWERLTGEEQSLVFDTLGIAPFTLGIAPFPNEPATT